MLPVESPLRHRLYDANRRQLFAGDFIYPGELYGFLPGSSRGAYLDSTQRLIAIIDPATQIFAAHMADPELAVTAPIMAVADPRAL